MRICRVIGAALVVAIATGCSGSSSPSPSPSASSAASSETPSVSPTVTSSPSAASPTIPPSSPPATSVAAGACATSALDLRAGDGGAAAGTYYIPLIVRNASSAPCSVYGYPGVSFLDSDGNQLGPSARRDRAQRPHRFVLQPGEKAHAVLAVPSTANFGDPADCGPAHAKAIRFYPPDQTSSRTTPTDVDVCTTRGDGQPAVGPMRPGTRGT